LPKRVLTLEQEEAQTSESYVANGFIPSGDAAVMGHPISSFLQLIVHAVRGTLENFLICLCHDVNDFIDVR